MFCSFRNGVCGTNQASASSNDHSPMNNGNCTNGNFNTGNNKSAKWHRGLLAAGTAISNVGSGNNSNGLIGLHTKCSSEWKPVPSFWKYLLKYRRHFRLPFIVSLLAIVVNTPAFFEISAIQCYFFPENRLGYGLRISDLRLNEKYKLWYKFVFRMLITSCGPNIFILCLTVLTVLILRGNNRSRKRLFHMNETAIDHYSSRAAMLTTISVSLVIKFLLLRSLSFVLDIWEVTFGLWYRVHQYIYLVDISNFLIIVNSSTNCLIIYGVSRWLHNKISVRNIVRREKQHCLNSVITKRRTMLLYDSWLKALQLTNRQFGSRILYAMLLRNPQMIAPFRDPIQDNTTTTTLSSVINLTASNGTDVTKNNTKNEVKFRELTVNGQLPLYSNNNQITKNEIQEHKTHSDSRPSSASTPKRLTINEEMKKLSSCNVSSEDIKLLNTSQEDEQQNSKEDAIQSTPFHQQAIDDLPDIQNKIELGIQKAVNESIPANNCVCKVILTLTPNATASKDVIVNLSQDKLYNNNTSIALGVPSMLPSIKITTPLLDCTETDEEYYDENNCLKNHKNEIKNVLIEEDTKLSALTSPKSIVESVSINETTNMATTKIINVEAVAAAALSVIPKKKKRSMDLLMNAKFHEFGEQITKFIGELIDMMKQGHNEQSITTRIQAVGKIHHDQGINFTSSSWKDFKSSALSIVSDCEFATEAEKLETLEAWSSLLSVIIHNMKLGMWNSYSNASFNSSSTSFRCAHQHVYCNCGVRKDRKIPYGIKSSY